MPANNNQIEWDDSPATPPKGLVWDDAPANPPQSGSPALAGPSGSTAMSAYEPSWWDRIKNTFTEGNPNYSSRTVSNPKYGQTQLFSPEESMTPLEQRNHPILTGIGEVAGGMTTPDSVAILAGTAGLGQLPNAAGAMIPKLVSLGFGASMIRSAYKTYPQVKAAADRGDMAEVQRLLTHMIGDVAFGYLAGRHVLGAGSPSTVPSTSADVPVEVAPTPNGEGTSAVNLVDQPPRTNIYQDIQNHTAEISRMQSILDNTNALPEEKAYAKQVIQSSIEQRASLQYQVGAVPQHTELAGVEEDDMPYRPPAGSNVTPGIYDTDADTSIPLFRETGSAEKSVANVGWYGKGVEGTTGTYESNNTAPLTPKRERLLSEQSNKWVTDNFGPDAAMQYKNNPPLLATNGGLPFNDDQYNLNRTEVAKRVTGMGHGPYSYDTPEGYNSGLADYEEGSSSKIDTDTEKYLKGKKLSDRQYPGQGVKQYPFGTTGSYKGQAELDPSLRRTDRSAYKQTERNNNLANNLYEQLEPHLNQSEKDVYDRIVSDKTRQDLTRQTGLSTQQQRTIENSIVEKGRRFVGAQFDIDPKTGQLEPRAAASQAPPAGVNPPLPKMRPSTVLRTVIGSHPYPETAGDGTPISSFNKDEGQPPVAERLRIHEKVLSGIADPERIYTPEDVNTVVKQTAQFLGGKTESYITKPLTLPLRQQLAREMGLTREQFLATPIGQAVSPEFIEAGRMILDASRNKLIDAMDAAREDPSKSDDAFEALAKHQMIKKVFEQRVAREAGRSLQAVNDSARGGDAQRRATYDDISNSFSKMSDSDKAQAIREFSLIDKDNPAVLEKFSREIKPSSTGDKIYEAWINALVSGGAFARKFLGDTAMEIVNKPTKGLSSMIDYARSKVTGTPQERFWGEMTPSKFAGMKEGFETFMKTFKDEISLKDRSGDEFASRDVAIKGPLGKIIRTPTRLLSAVTDGEHIVNYSTELHSLAHRIASQEGLRPFTLQYARRVVELVNNPTHEMRSAATKYAQTQTLQQGFEGPGLYNNTMRAVANMKNNGGIWKYLFPFVKTPANVIRESARYSPLGLVGTAKGYISGELKGGELSDALSKNILGTGAFAWALGKAMGGKITGAGPSDPKKRAALESTGWQPYSIKTASGKYVSWKGLPPAYMTVGLAADIAESIKENRNAPQIGTKVAAALEKFKDLGRDIPFLNTVTEIANLIGGKQNVGSTLANEVVPAGVRNVAHIVDPTVRKPSGIVQSFESQIPGLTKNVPAKTDITGKPIQRPASAVGGFNPYPVTQETTDPVLKEQARLAQLPKPPTKRENAGISPETPGEKLQLNAQEQIQLHQQITLLTKQGVFNGLTDPQKQLVIQHLHDRISKSRPERLQQLRKSTPTTSNNSSNRIVWDN